MSPLDQALNTLLGLFRAVFDAFLSFFGLIEAYLRELMSYLAIPAQFHGVIIVVVMVLVIGVIIKTFAGLFRIFLILFLVLLILHVLTPLLGI